MRRIRSARLLTSSGRQGSLAENKEVDDILFLLDSPTHDIDVLDQADIAFDKDQFSFWVQCFTFFRDAISSFLRAANEVDTRSVGVFDKGFERVFAYAAGGANEDCNKTRWEGGRNQRVG